MRAVEREGFGNPSAIHAEGRAARQVVESARVEVAHTLGIRPSGVTFVSGGTEANALAIFGHLAACVAAGRSWSDLEVVSTPLEHPSVSVLLEQLRERGVRVRLVSVTDTGLITPKALVGALSPQTTLVTFAYVNSEIGTVQPVGSLVRAVREWSRTPGRSRITVHLDAAQAPLWLPCQLPRLGVDMLSLDGGKCGGPKGSGAVARHGAVALAPIMSGGGQEHGLRPGTENVSAIAGFAAALTWAQKDCEGRSARIRLVRDEGVRELLTTVPGAVLNGPTGSDRVANNINISIPGMDTEYATVVLDVSGVAVSTKSACAGAGGGVSAVVEAVTGDPARAAATLRLTLGPESVPADVRLAAQILADHRARMDTLTQ
jgi:cysteine desulfurase